MVCLLISLCSLESSFTLCNGIIYYCFLFIVSWDLTIKFSLPHNPDDAKLHHIAESFWRDGMVVLQQVADASTIAELLAVAREQLAAKQPPIEYEADVGYPGAPRSRDEHGGKTVRRLRGAYHRDPALKAWAQHAQLNHLCQIILQGDELWLTQAHHNCLMTKHPDYSSQTHWHQDIRYWHFTTPDLLNVWLALVNETENNGALQFIPGSHRIDIHPEQFDADRFLLAEHPANANLLARAITVELNAGDVVLFHAKTLHAAGANHTRETKYSLVFTYHNDAVQPLPNTRSAKQPSVLIR